jgi:hypothetical protein
MEEPISNLYQTKKETDSVELTIFKMVFVMLPTIPATVRHPPLIQQYPDFSQVDQIYI